MSLNIKKNKDFNLYEEYYYIYDNSINHANCNCCYNGDAFFDDEIYDYTEEYINEKLVNFHKVKLVKNAFNETFLNNSFLSNKYKYKDNNSIILYPKLNDLSEDYKYLVSRFIDSDIYNFDFKLIVYFKDINFENVSKIDLRIVNKYAAKDKLSFSYDKKRSFIDINLIKIKNGILFYNNDNIENIIKKSHNTKSEKINFNDLCETNSDFIFNYFIENYKLVKTGVLKIDDLLKNKDNVKLLNLYLF